MHIIVTASLLAFGVGVFVVYNIAYDSKYRADTADMKNLLKMRRELMSYYEEVYKTKLSKAQDSYAHNGGKINIDRIRDEHNARIGAICCMDEAKIQRMYAEIIRR